MDNYDAIIVGAGPAGCAAAFDLATAGMNVLLVDRHAFPRSKACAGALTMKSIKALRYSVAPVVKQVCSSLQVSRRLSKMRVLRSKFPVCVTTVRAEFDNYCLSKTVAAGGEFRVIDRLQAVNEDSNGVTIGTKSHRFRAKFLIGADGTNSSIRRFAESHPWIHKGFAAEACVPISRREQFLMQFDFGLMQCGYGWVFPKGDHLNVGLYTGSDASKFSRVALHDYVKVAVGSSELRDLKGYPVGLGGANYFPSSRRVFLVGDAAGLVDALLGEGIHNAIRSGQAAAAGIISDLSGTGSALQVFRQQLAPIQADVASCAHAAQRFYGHLNFGYRALVSPLIRYALMKGYAMGMPLKNIKNNLYRMPLYRVTPVQSIY